MALPRQPNIIIIITDQQRAAFSKREGFLLDTTPSLDTMAQKGVWFKNAYSATPICGPSRVSLLTGRFPSAHRVCVNHALNYATFEHDLIDVVKTQRYKTALVGKNHSHLTEERVDYWYELLHHGQVGDVKDLKEKEFDLWLAELNHGVGQEPTPFPLELQLPCRAVARAKDWIRQVKGHPFFLLLSFPEPHNPYQVPEPYYSLYPINELPPVNVDRDALDHKSCKWRFTRKLGEYIYPNYEELIPRMRANYLGMLRLIDDQVKNLINFLDAEALIENTLVVFLADHGDFVGDYGLWRKGPELPEALIRIPLFFQGAGIKANHNPKKDFVSIIDIMPTLCEAIGIPLPHGVQGRSLWPLLTGENYPAEEFESIYAEQGYGGLHYTESDSLDYEHCLIRGPKSVTFDELNSYSQSGTLRMVRKENWKLVMDMHGQGQLYNLDEDPFELDNLMDQDSYTKIQNDLLQELVAWCLRTQDPLLLPEKGKYHMKKDVRNYYAYYKE